jgi:hypothetical protein
MPWTPPRDWTDGETVNAAIMDTHVKDNLLWLYAWLTATFSSYSVTPTNLSLGNGTLIGKYIQVGGTKLVVARLDLVWGSTTSCSGAVSFSLPVTAATGAGSFTVGFGEGIDSSVNAAVPIRARLTSSTVFTVLYGDNAGGAATQVNATGPWTWATSDELHLVLIYEAA